MGILTCLCMMSFLPADTWIRLVLWMLIGLDVYASYGIRHSKLEYGQKHRKGDIVLNLTGLILSILSVITGLWHQQTVGWDADKTLLTISFVCVCLHTLRFLHVANLETSAQSDQGFLKEVIKNRQEQKKRIINHNQHIKKLLFYSDLYYYG